MSIDVLTALKLRVAPQSPEDVARLADTGFFPPTVVYSHPGEYVWTCQRSGRYQLMCAGAGGGALLQAQTGTPPLRVTGGSGAVSRTTLDIMAGEILQITVPGGEGPTGSLLPDLYAPQRETISSARIVWPYFGARDNGAAIPGWENAFMHLLGISGTGQAAGSNQHWGPPHSVVQGGTSGSSVAVGSSSSPTAGVQMSGVSWAGPVQLRSGNGGRLNSPGGGGACLVAFISSL